MTLEGKELYAEFFETIKDQFPDVSLGQVTDVCRSPFQYAAREAINEPNLPELRYKYLGVFRVKEGQAYTSLVEITKNFLAGRMQRETFDKKAEVRINYLKRKDEEDTKNGEESKGFLEKYYSIFAGELQVLYPEQFPTLANQDSNTGTHTRTDMVQSKGDEEGMLP